MPTTDFSHQGLSSKQDPIAATIGRIGQMAAVVATAATIFAALYYFVLYVGSK